MNATQRVSAMGFVAPHYTPADFAEPDRRPLLVRWTWRAGEVTAEAIRSHVSRTFSRPARQGLAGAHR